MDTIALTQRVIESRQRLAKQADPLGIVAGTYVEEIEGDIIKPTKARIRHAGDRYEPGRDDAQIKRYKPARLVPRWEVFETTGKITKEQGDAGRTYERHMELSSRATVTPSYGQRHAEGTPSSQLDESSFQARAAAWVDYYGLHKQAVASIGKRDAEFLEQVILGVPLHILGAPPGISYKSGKHIASAVVRLRNILDALGAHYGQRRRRDPYP